MRLASLFLMLSISAFSQEMRKIDGFDLPSPLPADVQQSVEGYNKLMKSATCKCVYSIKDRAFIIDDRRVKIEGAVAEFVALGSRETVVVSIAKHTLPDDVQRKEVASLQNFFHEMFYGRVVVSIASSGLPTMDSVLLDSKIADWKKTKKTQ